MSVHIIYLKDGAKMMRPILTREEYLAQRNSETQKMLMRKVRSGNEKLKSALVQMNYSCLPNEDGSLKGSTRMSSTIGMDVDHIGEDSGFKVQEDSGSRFQGSGFKVQDAMEQVKQRILEKKDELGLLMLEESARGAGYHLVFRRRPELSQEDNLKWASQLLGVEYDSAAKDITRVFFTTTKLLYLDDEIFEVKEESQSTQSFQSTPITQNTPNTPITQNSPTPPTFPTTFKSLSYSSIIAEYWRRTGGEPSEGERNKRLHQLAANLRSICDDSEEWLLEVMPRFGLPEQEMRSIIHSACKEPTKGSRLMDGIVSALNENYLNENQNENENETSYENENENFDENFDEELSAVNYQLSPHKLPIGLRESLVGVPESMHMPVLCGVLPIAAAYADQVQVEYCDGNVQHLGLMSIIRGEQASNKSVVKNAVDVWKRQFEEEDALARKREEEWKERKKSRKANEKAPEDPHVLIRMVPVTVSCSTLLKRFKNAQGHTIYSFGEELDTLRKTNGAGSWSSKYDIYRLSFDKGEWGQDYNSDAAESGVVNVAYNWTMLGTNGAMRKCFKSDNIENGLSSRILVAEMPDASFSKMPKFRHRSAEDEARIVQAATRLRSVTGMVDTPRLRKAIEEWVEQKRVEAAKDIDHVKDTYRKRAAVIGFRCGVVFHLLSGREKESKACTDFALMMADYCLSQQIKTFGETLRNEYVSAQDESKRRGANHSVFDNLPPAFTIDDLRALKQGFCNDSALRMIIFRWMRDGWIEKTDRSHWKKLTVNS